MKQSDSFSRQVDVLLYRTYCSYNHATHYWLPNTSQTCYILSKCCENPTYILIGINVNKVTNLPALVMIISVPQAWNLSQISLFWRVTFTFGSFTSPQIGIFPSSATSPFTIRASALPVLIVLARLLDSDLLRRPLSDRSGELSSGISKNQEFKHKM